MGSFGQFYQPGGPSMAMPATERNKADAALRGGYVVAYPEPTSNAEDGDGTS